MSRPSHGDKRKTAYVRTTGRMCFGDGLAPPGPYHRYHHTPASTPLVIARVADWHGQCWHRVRSVRYCCRGAGAGLAAQDSREPAAGALGIGWLGGRRRYLLEPGAGQRGTMRLPQAPWPSRNNRPPPGPLCPQARKEHRCPGGVPGLVRGLSWHLPRAQCCCCLRGTGHLCSLGTSFASGPVFP